MRKKSGKKVPGSKATRWTPPSEPDMEKYILFRHEGDTQVEAYKKVFQSEVKGKSATMIKTRASRLEHNGAISIADVIRMLSEEDDRQLRDEVDGLSVRKELVGDLLGGIREAVKQSPLAIHTCVHSVKALCDIMGLNMPKELTVKSGGVTEDYKAPPALADMSDEELAQRIRELS